jgi:hypothetical protein
MHPERAVIARVVAVTAVIRIVAAVGTFGSLLLGHLCDTRGF